MSGIFKNSDPDEFPAWKKISTIKRFIESDANFADIRLLSNLKANPDDLTPVTLALYPASLAGL